MTPVLARDSVIVRGDATGETQPSTQSRRSKTCRTGRAGVPPAASCAGRGPVTTVSVVLECHVGRGVCVMRYLPRLVHRRARLLLPSQSQPTIAQPGVVRAVRGPYRLAVGRARRFLSHPNRSLCFRSRVRPCPAASRSAFHGAARCLRSRRRGVKFSASPDRTNTDTGNVPVSVHAGTGCRGFGLPDFPAVTPTLLARSGM